MSTRLPAAHVPHHTKNIPSTDSANNPFDTVFDGDGDDAEDEWWEEEDTVTSTPPKQRSDVRITQWPRPSEGVGLGLTTRPLNRSSTRKPAKRYSVQKPTRDKSKGRQRKQNAKAGIKVVTNFSRHQAAAPPVQMQPSQTAPQMGYFVDLAALQALNGDSTQTSTGFWKSKKGRELFGGATNVPTKGASDASAGRPTDQTSRDPSSTSLRRTNTLAPSPVKSSDDLSPNDRPIVIGISIPSRDVQEHTTFSPQTALSETTKIVRSYESRSPMPPETPTIIITPANEVSCWSPDTISASTDPRPSSGIYSQHDRHYSHSNAPPVPQMPASFLEDERQRLAAQKSYFSPDSDVATTWGEEDNMDRTASKPRVVSTCTVFEEDISPIMIRSARSASISADHTIGRHASISTVATRPRSRGWWNYITTPFLTRSNTFANRDIEDEVPPALPDLADAAAKALEATRDERSWEKSFSPMTPDLSATTIASETWWDLDTKKQNPDDKSPILRETRHKVQTSTDGLPIIQPETAGFGPVATMTTIASTERSQLSRENTSATFKSVSEVSKNDREVPVLMDPPNVRRSQNNNPFVQPRLGDFDDPPSNTQATIRQVAQPARATDPPVPSQPSISPSGAPPPPYSPSPVRVRYRAVFPPGHALASQYPMSPGPVSPGLAQTMSSQGAIPMSEVPLTPPARRPINLNSGYPQLPARQQALPFTAEDLQAPSKKAKKAEAKRRRQEKEDAIARKAGGLWRGRGCIPDSGCYGRKGAEGRKKRRCYLGLIVGFLFMIILVVVLATTLHRKSSANIGTSQWLNLTGFPPIFLGLSTVIAPANINTNTGCVFPATQWSCDLPKELQASVSPNQPNQPNFFLEIQWDNSSAANATFVNVTGNPNLGTRAVGNPVSAGQFIRSMILRARQIVTFVPIPAPPSFADEFFLGNTTDGIVSKNKAGEPTPFCISFVSKLPTVSKRDMLIRQRSSDPFPNATEGIPPPSLNSDGTAAPANLLPFPSQQPIRLYDRGLPTEHYGFYTYFDRSIFLKSLDLLNSTDNGEVPDDQNGGATEAEAAFRCTWTQTRFLVQMWTRMNGTSQLLNSTAPSSSTNQTLTQPGSFPYPITITTDRHGGDPALKEIYCYSMNDREGIVASSGKISLEDRGFGGTLINPAPSVFSNSSDPSLGGFDGGTGGCSCQWSNFQTVIHST